MLKKKKIVLLAVTVLLCLAAAGGTLAWYIREDRKQAQTKEAEVMAPYNLYLMNPNAVDSLQFAVGNLHPGEVKKTVICVSNKVPRDYAGGDNISELVKDSEFNYELQMVYTQNLAVNYSIYPLDRHDMPSDGKPPSEVTDAIRMDDETYDLYYWTRSAAVLTGEDHTDKMTKEVFGEEDTSDIVNIGKYMFYGDDSMKLAYRDGTYEYDY